MTSAVDFVADHAPQLACAVGAAFLAFVVLLAADRRADVIALSDGEPYHSSFEEPARPDPLQVASR